MDDVMYVTYVYRTNAAVLDRSCVKKNRAMCNSNSERCLSLFRNYRNRNYSLRSSNQRKETKKKEFA